MDSQRLVLLESDSERVFFKNIKSYGSHDKPTPFDVRLLLPDMTDTERAAVLADHFNTISSEFTPLEPSDIPVTRGREIEDLLPF